MECMDFNDFFSSADRLYRGVRLARFADAPDTSVLWIDDAEHIKSLLSGPLNVNGLDLICVGNAEKPADTVQKGAHIRMVDGDLMTVYDRAAKDLMRYKDWERSLLEAELSPSPIQGVADFAAEKLNGTIVLLNVEQQVLYFGGIGNCNFAPLRNATAFGQLNCLQDMQFDNMNICTDVEKGWHCKKCSFNGKLVCQILVFFQEDIPLCDVNIMTLLLRESFVRMSQSGRAAPKKYQAFSTILTDIVNGTLNDECEIDQLLSQLEYPPKQFCSFGIVDFSHERVINSARISLAHQLSEIFPGSSFTVYNNLLVVLISDDSRKNQPYPYVDYEKLNALLENCDAYIALSNATSRRSMLRTNFLLACSTLHIGRALSQNPHQRTFFYEEYVEYITIDLCANSFRETMGHDDIVFLTHPSVVRVYRYNKVHNTDLLNVLYCYCIKNCNVSLAAEAAFMHRNTFTSRLAKLRKIFTEDLNSGEVQHRVIFSYKVLQYYEKICNVKLIERFLPSPPV